MLHARKDYQTIQIRDIPGIEPPTIGEDEPVFLLRAKDKLAPSTLEFWADELEKEGGNKTTVGHVRAWANLMRVWQQDHGSKIPDAPPHVRTPAG